MSALPQTTLEHPLHSARKSVRGCSERRVLSVIRWPVGGIRTHVLYNYPDAANEGYRFTFVGPADNTFETFATSLEDLPSTEFVGAPVNGSRCHLIQAVRHQLRTGRFSLLHSHGLTAAMQTAIANIGLAIPHLATVHDPLRPEQFLGFRGRIKRWFMGRLLQGLDSIVCVGQDIRANLQHYLPALRHDRLVVIPNGIHTRHFAVSDPQSDDLRQRIGAGSDVTLIGFLGRFMEQKGFLPLLCALERLLREGPPRPFHVVAVGSGDFEREYRAEIHRRGLSKHVTMLGFVMDVRPILQQLDLLAVPSLWEASPLLPMEAMSAGIPVLGTDCIGLREVLRDSPSIMVRAGCVDALTRGLHDALSNPRTELARSYAKTARDRFDNRPSAKLLLHLFDELASATPRRQARFLSSQDGSRGKRT
jgi:glycosyltransferase involved in cell wall biosynthesis